MPLQSIEALLREEIGLDPGSSGAAGVEHAVRRRMTGCGLDSSAAYAAYVQGSREELELLIEEVAVPETWFFRDQETFRFLARWAYNEWWPRHPERELRALSLPCGSGEEAYTAVMALLDAGLPRFRVLGIDVRRAAVLKGRAATYAASSFRGDDLGFRERYFTADGSSFRLAGAVTERADFMIGNALDSGLLRGETFFDVILCRNLLIYLAPEARQLVLANLGRLLDNRGVLLAGHAEADAFARGGFRALRRARAAVFRKATSHPSGVTRTRTSPAQVRPAAATSPRRARSRPAASRADAPARHSPPASISAAVHRDPSPSPATSDASLDDARRLADQGRLDEAIELCDSCLEEHRDSAEAFFLLALLHQATGANGRAEEALHKVVYLEPDNYQALMCLALHKERRGEHDAAAALQRRAERALARSGRPDGSE